MFANFAETAKSFRAPVLPSKGSTGQAALDRLKHKHSSFRYQGKLLLGDVAQFENVCLGRPSLLWGVPLGTQIIAGLANTPC